MAVSLESVHYLCLNKMHKLREQGEGTKKTLIWPESKCPLIFPGRCFFILYSCNRKAEPQTFQVIFCWFNPPSDSVVCQPPTLWERALCLRVAWLADPRENHQVNISHQVCACVCVVVQMLSGLSSNAHTPHQYSVNTGIDCDFWLLHKEHGFLAVRGKSPVNSNA